jgi:glutamine---fructose-6-phosphate transaminase (isomerizing)
VNPDGFRADILEEPVTLDAMLAAFRGERLPSLEGRRAVMIGMGSSRFAALTAAAELRSRGVAAVAEYASTGLPAPPSRDTVAIGISASGRTPETVEALEGHRGISTTVAITNFPERELAGIADVVLPLHAGVEAGGVSCKTFQTSLALLLLVAGVPLDELRPAPAIQEELLGRRDEWLAPLSDQLAGAHTIYTIAPAERISSALESALMLREGPRRAADATETGDWLHVDVYLTKHPGYRALLFPGSRYDAGVMEWARERDSTIVTVGAEIEGAPGNVPFDRGGDRIVASLVETSVVELLAAEWWLEATRQS